MKYLSYCVKRIFIASSQNKTRKYTLQCYGRKACERSNRVYLFHKLFFNIAYFELLRNPTISGLFLEDKISSRH